MFLLKFITITKISLKLLIIEGIIWLKRRDFPKWFCFKLDLVIEIIVDNENSLRVNIKRKNIIIIVNLKKNIS